MFLSPVSLPTLKWYLGQYEIFNRNRLAAEAEQEAIADDTELKQIQSKIEKRKGKK